MEDAKDRRFLARGVWAITQIRVGPGWSRNMVTAVDEVSQCRIIEKSVDAPRVRETLAQGVAHATLRTVTRV